MKTQNNLQIPSLQHETLRNQIQQAAHYYSIIQVYYHEAQPSEFSHLLILTNSKKDAKELRNKKWVVNASLSAKTHIYISYLTGIMRQFELGNPFVHYYYQSSHLISADIEDNKPPFKIKTTQKSFKRKFNAFKESFYHDHDILLSEAKRFHALHSPISTYLTYISIFKHDLDYLENMYTGEINGSGNLHERIKNLIPHLPEIRKLFVKKNETRYYLLNKLEAAMDAAEHDEEININIELYDAVKQTESEMYALIGNRFIDLKTKIKFSQTHPSSEKKVFQKPIQNEKLDKVVSMVVKKIQPEEIYLFHQCETTSNRSENSTLTLYYFLMIGERINNQTILEIQQSVLAQTNHQSSVIILGHRRISVQERLFNYQTFMKGIMVPENKIYTSSEMHPPIHWEEPYSISYGDLSLYHDAAKNDAARYFMVRNNLTDENNQELMPIFSLALMRVMRVYLYTALYTYLPNYISTFDIWKLCVYADPSLEKIEFLFEKLDPDFYKTTDRFLKYTDRLYKLIPAKLEIMDEILNILMERLNEWKTKNQL